ncbi:hypothetical protein [Rhizosphaericola mali]|uniref:Lipoprotein n=1 Tax=Rhizosphaericola mali TaxID=2545455 RepID=A0A5P2G260_9BACT|nr:hypothetical protein [Rhizosphaericola mali]QES88179.1 hypothetical protein E0W69_005690 [Rhizosphaericola mali]
MKKIIILSLSLLTSAVLFTSCKKDTVVNQTSSNIYVQGQISTSDWTRVSTTDGSIVYKYSIDADSYANLLPLGNFSNNKDGLLVYASLDDQTYYPLMGNGTNVDGNYLYYFETYYDTNAKTTDIIITAEAINSNTTVSPSNMYVNLVFLQATASYNSTSNVNTNDYNAVIKAYNVKSNGTFKK